MDKERVLYDLYMRALQDVTEIEKKLAVVSRSLDIVLPKYEVAVQERIEADEKRRKLSVDMLAMQARVEMLERDVQAAARAAAGGKSDWRIHAKIALSGAASAFMAILSSRFRGIFK